MSDYLSQISLNKPEFAEDFGPLEEGCDCPTCRTYTRAYVHSVIKQSSSCHMISIHNVAFQLRLMRNIRESIIAGRFPQFIREFMRDNFPDRKYPNWVVDALAAVNVRLE